MQWGILMKISKRGVGFNSGGEYKTGEDSRAFPVYTCWKDMMDRCYKEGSKRYHTHGANGVVVCTGWMDYQVFAEWYHVHFIKGCHLDKDFLSESGKLYSPETCVFIPPYLNCLILNKHISLNGLPNGVSYRKNRGKYVAKVRRGGRTVALGSFTCPYEAFKLYKIEKEKLIAEKALLAFKEGYICKCVLEKIYKYKVRENL